MEQMGFKDCGFIVEEDADGEDEAASPSPDAEIRGSLATDFPKTLDLRLTIPGVFATKESSSSSKTTGLGEQLPGALDFAGIANLGRLESCSFRDSISPIDSLRCLSN